MSLPPGTLVKVLADFTALREDEISVNRGEVIQVCLDWDEIRSGVKTHLSLLCFLIFLSPKSFMLFYLYFLKNWGSRLAIRFCRWYHQMLSVATWFTEQPPATVQQPRVGLLPMSCFHRHTRMPRQPLQHHLPMSLPSTSLWARDSGWSSGSHLSPREIPKITILPHSDERRRSMNFRACVP